MLSGIINAFNFGSDIKSNSDPVTSNNRNGDFARELADSQRELAAVAETVKTEKTAVEKFMKYQEMTPAEKIRASYLAQHGLTEDDMTAMTAEERQKIENEILEEIKRSFAAKGFMDGGQA